MILFRPGHAAAFRWLLVLALTVTSWQALTPSPVPLPGTGADKLAHAGAFLLLAFLTDAAWPEHPFGGRALTLLALYGAGIEVAQHFVPNRFMSLGDLLANLTGLTLYVWLIGPLLRRQPASGSR